MSFRTQKKKKRNWWVDIRRVEINHIKRKRRRAFGIEWGSKKWGQQCYRRSNCRWSSCASSNSRWTHATVTTMSFASYQGPPCCIELQSSAPGSQAQSSAVCKAVSSVLFFAMHHSSLPTTLVWALETDAPARSGSVSTKQRKILAEEEEEETKKPFPFCFFGWYSERKTKKGNVFNWLGKWCFGH